MSRLARPVPGRRLRIQPQGSDDEPETIRQWVNAQLGKTQRLSALRLLDELPRSAIGKVLKRELRDDWQRAHAGGA